MSVQNRRFSRDVLVRTAAVSSSLVDLLVRLDAPLGSRTLQYVRRRLEHYGIDTSHFTDESLPPGERRSYTKERLSEAAANTHSIREMFEYMGYTPSESPYDYVRRKLDRLGIDTSHFTGGRRHRPLVTSLEDLRPALAESRSLAQALKRLGLADNGATRTCLKRAIDEYGLSTSHFTGRAHSRGAPSPHRKKAADILRRLEPGTPRTRTSHLRRALDDLQVVRKCSACGIGDTWQGKRLVLEIDHINGDRLDNRHANLRYLCPNCHSLTATWCRNRHRSEAVED
ncbi:HNH endonuclease [Streptomyces sp. NBC_00178]|uniref:HNH endonuclease signature motif containing protein n=1 Tax=Streptomyces sp. NBC_00178 TaxID=2975672 RepID=UPI002E2C46A1|nr:HNH endonuclease signature motif containing protein [Streptomyces sp. NBC_00178]